MANPEHGPVSSPQPLSGTTSTPSTPPIAPLFANGASGPPSGEGVDLRSPSLYLNRELSWLEFNTRVLAEAASEAVPLLERLKFHAIVASNLDEFFMVRVAGLKQQLTGEVGDVGPDGLTPHEQLVKLTTKVRPPDPRPFPRNICTAVHQCRCFGENGCHLHCNHDSAVACHDDRREAGMKPLNGLVLG